MKIFLLSSVLTASLLASPASAVTIPHLAEFAEVSSRTVLKNKGALWFLCDMGMVFSRELTARRRPPPQDVVVAASKSGKAYYYGPPGPPGPGPNRRRRRRRRERRRERRADRRFRCMNRCLRNSDRGPRRAERQCRRFCNADEEDIIDLFYETGAFAVMPTDEELEDYFGDSMDTDYEEEE